MLQALLLAFLSLLVTTELNEENRIESNELKQSKIESNRNSSTHALYIISRICK